MKKLNFLLIPIFIFHSTSCTKEDLCTTLAICDLTSKIAIPAASILLGTDLSVLNTVLNIADNSVDCGTEAAPQSESDFYPFYREDENSQWQRLTDPNNNIISIPTIPSSQEKTQERTYIFNSPGQYQFRTNADYNDKVIERDDSNNGFEITGRSSAKSINNNQYISEILTVLPNPDIPFDASKPKIELLSTRWTN